MDKRSHLRKDGKKLHNIGEDQSEKQIPVSYHSITTFDESFDQVNRQVSDAIKLRSMGNEIDARKKLVEAIDILDAIIKNLPKTSTKRKQLEVSRGKYKLAIEELESTIDREQESPKATLVTESGQPIDDNTGNFYKDQVGIVRKEDMSDFPDLEDIVGLEEVKNNLEFELDFDKYVKNPKLRKVMTGSRAILMYGPPGNGKTDLARAVAKEKDVNFIYVRPSDIFNKYVGESAKFLRGIFEKAYESEPCIIFIDEIDSIGSSRSSDESEARRDTKTEFLQLMSGFASRQDQKVWVMAATNRPFDLDTALVGRRFPPSRQIYVGPPDKNGRKQLMKRKLEKGLPKEQKISEIDYDELAKMTDKWSGSNLKDIVIDVRERPIRELFETNKSLSAQGKPLKSIPRPITMQDFKEAIISTPPSDSKEEIEEIRRWGEKNKQQLKVEENVG